MTQEEKAKAYDEALERAKIWKYKSGMPKDKQGILDDIFPELRESEDERIRKEIIAVFKGQISFTSEETGKKYIDWLEKQGEPNPYSGISFKYNGHTWGMCARDNGVEILVDGELKAFLSSEKSFIYPIHHQSDIAPKSAMEAIKEEKDNNQNCGNPFNYENANIQQKDFASIKPTFHKGDWVVNNISKDVFLIKSVNNGYCTLEDIKGNIISPCLPPLESESHLWSIEDAKAGDVLVEDSCIFIIQKFGDNGTAAKTYCTLYNDGDFDDGSILYFDVDSTYPATKEQRETLFKAMKEAGYEWDAEKKELKENKL